jgi:hypothetical protein
LAGVEDAAFELSLELCDESLLLSNEPAELPNADEPESELLLLSEDELESESFLPLSLSEEAFGVSDEEEPELCEESATVVESSAYVLKKG